MNENSLNDAVTMRAGASHVIGTIDQYELKCELGGGGFGCVYLARDTVAGIDVAVKGLPPLVRHNKEELENIRRNFALVSRLHHPNIAAALTLHPVAKAVYGNNADAEKLRVFEGDTLVVMQYAPGVTLSQWRKQFPENKVPFGKALEIVRQIASALDYAHQEKILHRDIKPANVMIETGADGKVTVRVLDFGLAAEIRSSIGRVSCEITDTSGTRPYMSPEQWTGCRQGPATDQYSLAVLFCELVTGEVPFASVFETGDPAIMVNAVKNETLEKPLGLPKQAYAALVRALAKKREARYGSCMEFVAALAGDAESRPAVSGCGRGTGATRRWSLAAACLALLAAVLAGGVWSWSCRKGKPAGLGASAVLPDIKIAKRPTGVQLWMEGPYWADRNIGGENPWDCGYYFWWGDTVGYKRVNDSWMASDGRRSGFSFEKQNVPTCGKSVKELESEGWITGDGVLAREYDAAVKHWGGSWRMPTKQEYGALKEKCDWTWMNTNGVRGYVVRGRGGYASASIFLPVAGFGERALLRNTGSYGNYWSSVPILGRSDSWGLGLISSCWDTYGVNRSHGLFVRPVKDGAK